MGMKLMSARVGRFRTKKPTRRGVGKTCCQQTTADTLPHRQPPLSEKSASGSLTGGHRPSGCIRRVFGHARTGPLLPLGVAVSIKRIAERDVVFHDMPDDPGIRQERELLDEGLLLGLIILLIKDSDGILH